MCLIVFLIQNSYRRSALQVYPSRLLEILYATLKFTGVKEFCFLLIQRVHVTCSLLLVSQNTLLYCKTFFFPPVPPASAQQGQALQVHQLQ